MKKQFYAIIRIEKSKNKHLESIVDGNFDESLALSAKSRYEEFDAHKDEDSEVKFKMKKFAVVIDK